MPDGFERPVYARDGRDTGDATSEDADVAEDGFVDDAPAPARDRQWTEEEKAVVVSECCWPGRRVGEVAQRYGLSVNRVNGWRSQARRGRLASPFSPEAEAEPVEAAQAGRTLGRAQGRGRAGPRHIEAVTGIRRARGGGSAAGFGRFGVDRGARGDGPP